MRSWLAAWSLALASCGGGANNAVLELEVEVPGVFDASGRSMTHVAFAARRGTTMDFRDSWSASEDRPLGASQQTVVASVVADERFDETLRFKVIYCSETPCLDTDGSVTKWYEIEEPFRRGRVTAVAITSSAEMPETSSTAPEVIGRCFVRGCEAVPPPSELTGYCNLAGEHPCDR